MLQLRKVAGRALEEGLYSVIITFQLDVISSKFVDKVDNHLRCKGSHYINNKISCSAQIFKNLLYFYIDK